MTCTPRIVRIRARIASASATPEMAISFIALAPCNDVYYTKNPPRGGRDTYPCTFMTQG